MIEPSIFPIPRTNENNLKINSFISITTLKSLKKAHVGEELRIHLFVVIQVHIIPSVAEKHNQEHIIESVILPFKGVEVMG